MFETFSKRQRQKERAGEPDVYQYDDLPRAFRNQVVWIWSRALGPYYDARGYAMSQLDALHGALHGFYPHHDTPLSNQLWDLIARTLAEDLGVFSIGQSRASSFDQCVSFLQSANTDGALDTIDLSFRIVNNLRAQPQGMRSASGIMLDPDEAIALLNTRFREHRIGYEFVSGELVRIDEQFIHQQVVISSWLDRAVYSALVLPASVSSQLRIHDGSKQGWYKAGARTASGQPFHRSQ
jgi:hypothetical protein